MTIDCLFHPQKELKKREYNTAIIARLLLAKILEDLNPNEFTLQNIEDNFNAASRVSAESHGIMTHFSKKHLHHLVDIGAITLNTETGKYSIDNDGCEFIDLDWDRLENPISCYHDE